MCDPIIGPTISDVWALVDTILTRIIAEPKGVVYVGKDYELAELRDDLREIVRLSEAVDKYNKKWLLP